MSNKKVRVSDIAKFLGKDFFGKDLVVLKPADLKNKIAKNSLLFVNLPSHINNDLKNMKNICVLLAEKSAEYKFSYIIVDNPRLEYAKVIEKFFDNFNYNTGIHPTAIIGKNSKIGKNCSIGAYTVISNDVNIGDGTVLGDYVKLHDKVEIGNYCNIGNHSSIGHEGFGFERDKNNIPVRIPHVAGVVIKDNVVLGPHNTIARGTINSTIIENYVKTDAQVHIAHNCHIGERSMIASFANLSGSVKVEEDVWIAPNTSIMNNITIGNNAVIGLGAVVVKSVLANQTVVAFHRIINKGNPTK